MDKQEIVQTLNKVREDMQELRTVIDIIVNTSITDITDQDLQFVINSINLENNQLWTNIIKPTILSDDEPEIQNELVEKLIEKSDDIDSYNDDDEQYDDEDQETPDVEPEIEIKKERQILKQDSDILKETLNKIRSKQNE